MNFESRENILVLVAVAEGKEAFVELENRMESKAEKMQNTEMDLVKRDLEVLKSGLQEIAKSYQFKMDRMAAALKRMEEVQSHLRQEITRQYAELSGRVNERRIAESKLNDMIDSHKGLVASFESRLTQIKKMMDEKEMRFLQTRSELEEAYRELQRTKRS